MEGSLPEVGKPAPHNLDIPHALVASYTKTKILTKQGSDTIHDIITKKYRKYPSNKILKHANVLSKVNKLPWRRLQNMTPHEAYSITNHVLKMTLVNISHKQKE